MTILLELTLDSSQIRYDALALTTTASGHLCLNLSETVSWEEFPAYANAVLTTMGGKRIRVAEAADIRLWEVTIEGQTLRLVFDDFPAMVSLESGDAEGDAILRRLYGSLSNT
jgi:hypothetical protein